MRVYNPIYDPSSSRYDCFDRRMRKNLHQFKLVSVDDMGVYYDIIYQCRRCNSFKIIEREK